MALTLFGFQGRPHDFAVTKADLPLEECVFLLDFSRPLGKHRWFGKYNRWIGVTMGLFVPVVHQAEEKGEFVISIRYDEAYFRDVKKLWKQHYKQARSLVAPPVGGLEVVADFGRHFPEDCQVT